MKIILATVVSFMAVAACGDTVEPGDSTCTNQIQDNGETGVDCGGNCEACELPPAPCANGRRDGDEEGIDCGGSCPTACATGCTNGVQDGDETGVDCGGDCAPCVVAPSCADNIKNQTETDVDCGGVCGPCGLGQACGDAGDCVSGVCTNALCAIPSVSCDDDIENGNETAVDCGGDLCGACADGETCIVDDDCASVSCETGLCAGCASGRADGNESDVDCGGDCPACATGQACGDAADCDRVDCVDGKCAAATCSDGRANGDESDIDCGGSCAPCDEGKRCRDADDCAGSQYCPATADARCTHPTVSKVTVGGNHTCALVATIDEVFCWGSNEFGQLGVGDTVDRDVPTKVPGLSGVIDLAAGNAHTCAVLRAGEVKCWGQATSGKIGAAGTGVQTTPATVSGLLASAVDAGVAHTCVVTTAGGVKCFGANTKGELGTGTKDAGGFTPVDALGLSSGVTALSVGTSSSCALKTGGVPYCWGNNFSQLMLWTSGNEVPTPTALDTVGWDSIHAGDTSFCVANDAGRVECWGSGTDANSNAPEVYFASGGQGVTCGLTACYVIDASGAITYAYTGGTLIGLATQRQIDAATQIAYSAISDFGCYLSTDANLLCAGSNTHGQLGLGSDAASEVDAFTPVVGLSR